MITLGHNQGRLLWQFRMGGKLHRVYIGVPDTLDNRSELSPKLTRLNLELANGTLDLETEFPAVARKIGIPLVVKRPVIPRVIPTRPSDWIGENVFETKVCMSLRTAGMSYRKQVRCRFGKADIVTDRHIIENKLILTTKAASSAVGQLLLYRAALGLHRAMVICCLHSFLSDAQTADVTALGIQIVVFGALPVWLREQC